MNDTPAERGAESTWTRLRRRKVVQWGVVYVAASWGFLQGLEYVGESTKSTRARLLTSKKSVRGIFDRPLS